MLEPVLIGILLICIGFISLAAGYRLLRLLLPIIGFIIGFIIFDLYLFVVIVGVVVQTQFSAPETGLE